MPTRIGRDDTQRMIAEGAQLVDVRAREDYDAEHLPGAQSLPVKSLDGESAGQLERSRPVITYCWESQ